MLQVPIDRQSSTEVDVDAEYAGLALVAAVSPFPAVGFTVEARHVYELGVHS